MNYCDTNIILRYLLADNDELFARALTILEEKTVFVPNEVLAEVVYVLTKTYQVPKIDACKAIDLFCQKVNVLLQDENVVSLALIFFAEKNIDFVDALLCAASKSIGVQVFSFDKKLNKCVMQDW